VPAIVVIKIPLAALFANSPIPSLVILEQLAVKLAGHPWAGLGMLGL
jgi:hypothetical protein